MPYQFKFYVHDNVLFCARLQSERCVGRCKNGAQCSRTTVIGTDLCWSHLLQIKHLRIKTSTIPNAGKGLFATDQELGPDDIVFKKGATICSYEGELINADELRRRYGHHTAPYALQLRRDAFIDSATERGYASLANRGAAAGQNNARFVVYRQSVLMKATKNIRNGQEILVSYGSAYRFDEPTHYTTRPIA